MEEGMVRVPALKLKEEEKAAGENKNQEIKQSLKAVVDDSIGDSDFNLKKILNPLKCGQKETKKIPDQSVTDGDRKKR